MMKYNIATGKTRFQRTWHNVSLTWEELRDRLKEPVVTSETMADYRAMGRDRQTAVKDVGGFVGGYLADGKRSAGAVTSRSLAALDYDSFDADHLERARKALGCRMVIHSTHKHREDAWRVRVVVPFSRNVTVDEYGAVARKIAEKIGFDGIDRSTFEACRMMFWPSRSTDAPYLFEETEGDFLDPGKLLSEYSDWRDYSEWPLLPEEEGAMPSGGSPGMRASFSFGKTGRDGKQEDPLEKKGLIGAFCRTYGIEEAIARFLPDRYTPFRAGRYTRTGSSTSGGAWVLDGNRFLYSFHGTDPMQGKLVNSWDLVRGNLFGDEDRKEGMRPDRLPSVKLMEDLALNDPAVRRRLMDERMAAVADDFEGMDLSEEEVSEEDVKSWDELRGDRLKTNKTGEVKTNASNLEFVIGNHPRLKGRIRLNEFTGKIMVEGSLPWRRDSPTWTGNDSVKLRSFLDRSFGMTGEKKIDDALISVAMDHGFHPVRDYLDSLEWDGVKRLGRVFADVLGAEDLPVYGKLAELIFTAAVRRIRRPGCKFDYFVVIHGPEGCGKSSLFSIMGGEWFSDSVDTIEGKEGRENIQGKWIVEMGELSGVKKSDQERLKNFISSQTDDYRAAYARMSESRPRQCILVGTTNEDFFLRGLTARNRRQPVVEIDPKKRKETMPVRDWLEANRDQMWAEACAIESKGEPLFLGDEWEAQIREVQDRHNLDKSNALFPEVKAFLDYRLPDNWEMLNLEERRTWIRNQTDPAAESIFESRKQRVSVTVAEILQEFFGMEKGNREYISRGREIGQYLSSLSGEWTLVGPRRHRIYGNQKTWQKVTTDGSVVGSQTTVNIDYRDFLGSHLGSQDNLTLNDL